MKGIIILAGMTVSAGLMVTGCGGSGQTTLHGTFAYTDTEIDLPADCSQPPGGIQIAVDGLIIGTAHVHYGKVVKVGGGVQVCSVVGKWSMSVPTASKVYALKASGESGTVRVTPANAGKSIDLSSNQGS